MIGATEIEREFASFVGSASFSCLVGKGVVHQNAHVVRVYPPLGTQAAASALATDLNAFAAAEHDPMKLRAFVAVFPRFAPRTEHAFEKRLWAQLQHLHERDDPDVEWDPSVSDDPDDPMFSFSFGGHASSSSACTRTARASRAPFAGRRWCSIRTRSSGGCAARDTSSASSSRSASVRSPCRDRSIRTSPTSASGRRRASIRGAPSRATGAARFIARTLGIGESMTVVTRIHLEPQTGARSRSRAASCCEIIDPRGEQVSDLVSFARADPREWLSSGRTIDYANTIYVTTGHTLYSNRSRPMWTIVEDTVGRHDFLLTPCSPDTFRILYKTTGHHPSCFENLAQALAPFGIAPDAIPTTLNIFMNVEVAPTGELSILPPRSRAGDHIVLRAEMDLIVGVTACSAELSNNGTFKPIDVELLATRPSVVSGRVREAATQHAHRRSGAMEDRPAIGHATQENARPEREPAAHGALGEPERGEERSARGEHARRALAPASDLGGRYNRRGTDRDRDPVPVIASANTIGSTASCTTKRAGRAISSYACRTRCDQKCRVVDGRRSTNTP